MVKSLLIKVWVIAVYLFLIGYSKTGLCMVPYGRYSTAKEAKQIGQSTVFEELFLLSPAAVSGVSFILKDIYPWDTAILNILDLFLTHLT